TVEQVDRSALDLLDRLITLSENKRGGGIVPFISTKTVRRGTKLKRSAYKWRVYLVTRWREHPSGLVEALNKIDVTDEYERLRANDAFHGIEPALRGVLTHKAANQELRPQ